MNKRPKPAIKLALSDKIIEAVGAVIVVAMWSLVAGNYAKLPDIIPTHYNGAGVADGFGDKQMIFTLPVLGTVLFIGMTVLNKFPHKFNYVTEITADNALTQYTIATRMIRWLKAIVVLIFAAISYQTIRHAKGTSEGLGSWFLPLAMGLILIPLFYFLIKSSQNAK